MTTATHAPLPSILDRFHAPATQPKHSTKRFNLAALAGLAAVPAAAALVGGLRSRRTALVAGGLTAVALGALRWQLARWFTPSPAYTVESRANGVEIRRYPMRIEARAELEVQDFEAALHRGFSRLACYLYGANAESEDIAMTTPCVIAMRDGVYSMAIAMPPGRALASLPAADDPRVALREVPTHRVAVLPFRGRFTRDNVADHELRLLKRLVDAGLSARGSVAFAGYDSPVTLPLLRRNEVWIEIV
jgi:SOUL heme-binding protein